MTLFFFGMFFLSPEIDILFRNRQQSNARAGQRKTHVFFGDARPKSNARAHLKQRKKHSGLTFQMIIKFVFLLFNFLFIAQKYCYVTIL